MLIMMMAMMIKMMTADNNQMSVELGHLQGRLHLFCLGDDYDGNGCDDGS